ncbi:MAG: efflux RND transporter permease subunit [Chloroflexi bacterium]|nr:efflux RND transporter permease subunit [Chloroflexota bacterium]
MSPTKFALRNPLIVSAITAVLILFGIYSYASMGISLLPNFTEPAVIVTTADPGADPASVETQVTKPLEDAIAGLPNVQHIDSTSADGLSSITVQFTNAVNVSLMPVDVERVVNSARSKLPSSAEAPNVITFDVNQIPVIIVALSGNQPLDQLQQVATDRLQRPLEALNGVASVGVNGGETREIHVNANIDQLQARGLSLTSIQQALASQQLQMPAGTLSNATKDVNVRLNGLVSTPQQLGDIVVAQTATGPVQVKDVATIDDTFKKRTVLSRVDGVPSVSLVVTKLGSANSIQIAHDVRAALPKLQSTLPQGMKLSIGYDTSIYTPQSFNTIQKTLVEAVFLTGFILLLFLHTWRSTLIVLVAIPTSVLSTFVWMNILGINLNLFSMLALTLAVGILVDDSIVVLENIYRHLGLKEPPFIAALNGRSEIGLAALTITLVDVAVYLPIALIPNFVGQILQSFALVITAATLTSLVVSFTLTPLLASRYLRLEHAVKSGSGPLHTFGRWWDRGFERLARWYQGLLKKVLTGRVLFVKGRWVVIFIGLASFALGMIPVFSGAIGFDIFPSGDQSEVDVSLQMPSATSISVTDGVAKELEARLKADKRVTQVFTFVGGGGGNFSTSSNIANMYVSLVPRSQRSQSAAQIADDMNAHLAEGIPGAKLIVGTPNAFGFGGFGAQPIAVSISGPNPAVINQLVDQVTAITKSIPGATDVNNDNETTQPEYVVQVDQTAAADLGITSQQAASNLAMAVDGVVATTFQQPGQDNVDVRLMAADAFKATPSNLNSLPLLTSKGTIVSLGQIGSVVNDNAPTQIQHHDRDRSVTVHASATGRLAQDVQTDLQTKLKTLPIPPGYSINYTGEASTGADAFNDIFKAMGVGMALIYLLMLMLFRSVMLPLAVLMSLPLAVIGSFGAMTITHTPFTLFSLLGFTLLVGLVGKNAILLVDYTHTLRARGEDRTTALLEAGPTRLRPIVMTTLSVIAALAPVAAGLEEGSELLKAAAIVLIGGLITSTLLTLVFVPSMYTVFDDIQNWVVGLFRRVAPVRQPEPEELAYIGAENGHSPSHNGSGHAPLAESQEELAVRV